MYNHIKEIVADSEKTGKPISELIIEQECKLSGLPREKVWNRMKYNLETMRDAVKHGQSGNGVFSSTGLTGGEAVKIKKYREKGHTLSGDTIMTAVQNAVATNEVNAAMGVICATPTAGSSGTLPGVLFMLEKRIDLTEEQMIRFLFTAGGFGMVIANNAEIAGATGGCQAEVGSASAMGAAAAVEAAGGTAEQSAQALSIAMSNLLGLVCDPIAGLVEVPCVKRNAIGAGNALIAADMALAGCTSVIPPDECIDAMKKVGHQMPASLRETGIGGLAGTPTGQAIKAKIFGEDAQGDNMRDSETIKNDIIAQLATVIDPELNVDVVNLGLIYEIDLDKDGICLINMTLTTPACPLTGVLISRITEAVKKVDEVKNVDVEFVWYPVWTPDRMSDAAKEYFGYDKKES